MKRLFLLRHAKASRDDPGLEDRERPLTNRGHEDALRMGRLMRREVYLPDKVLCSSSVRTRQTVRFILPELANHPAVDFLPELYLADANAILALIHRAPAELGSLMVVGHNPGIAECALLLAAPAHGRKKHAQIGAMEEKFTTGAMAVLDFDSEDWRSIAPGTGELEFFVRPKDIEV